MQGSAAGRPDPGRPAELLAEVFDEHAPMVLGLCRSLLRDAHDGEDAAQQTFVSAYASLIGGTRPRDSGAWLATIARNECRTRIQRRMREPLPLADAGQELPAPAPVDLEDVESLRLALANLPRQQRQAFLLREFSGFSYEELAQALGVSLPAVESLLFRARRRLRTSLRSAAATTLALPAAMRDLVTQLFAGSGETPTTLAKLGSAPLLAKLASVGAGAALLSAGAVAVVPRHTHRRPAPKPTHALAAPAAPRPHVAPPASEAPVVRAAPVADHDAPVVIHASAPAPVSHPVVRHVGDQAAAPRPASDRSAPETKRHTAPPSSREGDSGPTPRPATATQPEGSDQTTTVVEESSHDGSDGSGHSGSSGSGSSGSGSSGSGSGLPPGGGD